MARIRTIKPEIWTSEQYISCTPYARLLFIGMFNFCDCYGVHPASVVRIKAEIFPCDNLSTSEMRGFVDELIENHLIEEYAVSGERYWHVIKWDRHQVIDLPTGKWPLPGGEIGQKIRRGKRAGTRSVRGTPALCSGLEKERKREKEREPASPPSEFTSQDCALQVQHKYGFFGGNALTTCIADAIGKIATDEHVTAEVARDRLSERWEKAQDSGAKSVKFWIADALYAKPATPPLGMTGSQKLLKHMEEWEANHAKATGGVN